MIWFTDSFFQVDLYGWIMKILILLSPRPKKICGGLLLCWICLLVFIVEIENRLINFPLRFYFCKLLEFWLSLVLFVTSVSYWVFFDNSFPLIDMELLDHSSSFFCHQLWFWFLAMIRFWLKKDPARICLIWIVRVRGCSSFDYACWIRFGIWYVLNNELNFNIELEYECLPIYKISLDSRDRAV